MDIALKTSDFDYILPKELIAKFPLQQRSSSRLLCLDSASGNVEHQNFSDLISLLNPGDLLVCNNSKVIPARILGRKETGGKVEALIERIVDDKKVIAHLRTSKKPKPGSLLYFKNTKFQLLGRKDDLFELLCLEKDNVLDVIESIGEMPIPPYFERKAEDSDSERYQTIYADKKGSVAAPTAGLHFDEVLIQKLKDKKIDIDYVTLHVGAGTFSPVRVENIKDHKMHSEYVEVSQSLCDKIIQTKKAGGKVIAVGTTTVRSLEFASQSGEIKEFKGDANLFIYPGYKFNCVDGLITNFHLPSSTLLMLVTAFAGYQNVMQAYNKAISEKYRFYSYGDAMFTLRSCS